MQRKKKSTHLPQLTSSRVANSVVKFVDKSNDFQSVRSQGPHFKPN
jgi:hypothetical protein